MPYQAVRVETVAIDVVTELLELHTCLTVAEKALLWQAPRIGLEAKMDLEASIMYTDEDGARTRWEILKQLLDVRCGQMEMDGKIEHNIFGIF